MSTRLELFVDDQLIDTIQNAVLKLHHPIPREIAIEHDQPWEGNTCGYHTIFYDEGRYRMYYRGSHYDPERQKAAHPEYACYAESKDGIHWEKPALGLVDFGGSRENNILWEGPGTHNFTPVKDTNPDCPRESRYKALGRGHGHAHQQLLAFHSPDGIHWSLMTERPVITQGAFDSQNLGFWDSARGEYRAYFRDFRDGFRDIKTCTSHDFLHWTEPVWLNYGDAPQEHLYTNQVMPYYRAPHIFLGFPTRYLPDRGSLTEGLLMSSRDGVHFHRWEEALIRPGLNRDRWHNRSDYIWWGLVETDSPLPGAGSELSLYSNERYYFGKGARIRRYTCRIDGFVSVQAGFDGGEFVTQPLRFAGNALLVNVSTSAAGSLKVELQDEGGNPLPGFTLSDCPEIYGDEIEHVVEWAGGKHTSTLAGKTVRLRCVLRDADLYAIGFRSTSPS